FQPPRSDLDAFFICIDSIDAMPSTSAPSVWSSATALKEVSKDRKNPIGHSEVMSFEIPKFSLSRCPSCAHKISKLSIFPSYGLGCYTAPVCSFLMDRSGNPQPSHLGEQCGSFPTQFCRCAVRSTDDPAGLLQCFQNQSAIRVFQGLR